MAIKSDLLRNEEFEPIKFDSLREYEEFEEIVRKLIEGSTTSRADAQERMAQFYQDHPRPTS